MTDKDMEQRLNAAIELLIAGKPEKEKHALANMMRSSYAHHETLLSNVAGIGSIDDEVRKMRFLYQAVACLGMCLTTLADVLSHGIKSDEDKARLGGVVAGLDRAICYIEGRPYGPRVDKKELDAALLLNEALSGELKQAQSEVERLNKILHPAPATSQE